MKKTIKYIFILTAMLHALPLISQWSADTRLTNNTAFSTVPLNNARCISSSGQLVVTVWQDSRDGNSEIYAKRSTNAGVSWSNDARLTNNTLSSEYPSVEVSGVTIHTAWVDGRDGNYEIYYKRSGDAGINWSNDIRLSNNSSVSEKPSITLFNSTVVIVWDDQRDGNQEIYMILSTDAGLNWGAETRITSNSAISDYPDMVITASAWHLVWRDLRQGPPQVYYKRSTNSGLNWSPDIRLINTTTEAENISVDASGTYVHVCWTDFRDSDYEIYHKRSTDNGSSWQADTRMTASTGNSSQPSISASGNYVHLVWDDDKTGNVQLYYRKSSNYGESWDTELRFVNTALTVRQPSVNISDHVVHLAWEDSRDGNPEIYYKRNPTGNPVGISGMNTEIPGEFSLSQNYPNPFNPTTKIRFDISGSSAAQTSLSVYDLLGREVAALVNEELKPGTYEVNWDASNFPGGVYFYRISAGSFSETRKMILIK